MNLWENLKSFYLSKPVFLQELWFWWYQSIFRVFWLILFLFLLLIRYYTGKEGNNLLLVVATILFFFIVMLNPFVILAIFVAVIYSLFLLYPMMNQEKEQTNLVFEEVVTVKKEKNRWFGNLHHFQATRLASLMISISFVSWARIPFIWRGSS